MDQCGFVGSLDKCNQVLIKYEDFHLKKIHLLHVSHFVQASMFYSTYHKAKCLQIPASNTYTAWKEWGNSYSDPCPVPKVIILEQNSQAPAVLNWLQNEVIKSFLFLWSFHNAFKYQLPIWHQVTTVLPSWTQYAGRGFQFTPSAPEAFESPPASCKWCMGEYHRGVAGTYGYNGVIRAPGTHYQLQQIEHECWSGDSYWRLGCT